MTLTACPSCGTQTGAGVACVTCGTPVPTNAAPDASSQTPVTPESAGHAQYWRSLLPRVQRLLAPRYVVTEVVGYGGMAGVFAAEEPRLGRRVAVKVMSPALMMDTALVERFVQEARTIALLDHPNIVDIYEVEEREELHWFVMTFLPGRTLAQVMTDTAAPLPFDVIRAWLYQVGDALAYAHHHGIVHRDIKPGNVLLDQRGNAHVTDFGIAKATDGEAGLTRTGMLVGTPAYMSPEQCSSGDVGGASDQYSLGAVAYQMLTGHPPFEGATLAVLQAHVMAPPRRIEALRPDCPPDLAEAVHRMLAKRPEDRWPGMGAAVAAAGAAPLPLDHPLRPELELIATHAAAIDVVPAPGALREGARQALRVVVRDAAGHELPNRRVAWRSSTAAVAAVRDDVISAYSPGHAHLEAACGGARATFQVSVEADPVQALTVAPKQLTLPRGGAGALRADVLDLDGTRLDERAVLWSTSDPAIARVSLHGEVQGVATGDAVIVARTGARFDTASITVTAELAAPAAAPPRTPVPGWTPAQGNTAPGAGAAAPAARPAAPVASVSAVSGGAPDRQRQLLAVGAAAVLVIVAGAMFVGPRLLGDGAAPTAAEAPPVADDPGPTDVAGQPAEPVPEVPAAPEPADAATAAADVAEPPVPTTGLLRLGGELPAGAIATARARDGRTWTLGRAVVSLPPGSYALEINAPGYEPELRMLDVRAGALETWAPAMRAVAAPQAAAQAPQPAPQPAPVAQTPPPAPPVTPPAPTRDLAADRAAVQAEVNRFVEAMGGRDAAVLPLFTDNIRTQWQTLFTNTSSFAARLGSMQAVQLQDDAATVRFTVNVSFRNPAGAGSASPTFTATARRSGNSWRIVSVGN